MIDDEYITALAQEEIARRVQPASAIPPLELDLFRLLVDDYEQYGLPLLPEEQVLPERYAFLRRMLSPTPRFIKREDFEIHASFLHTMGGDAGGSLAGATGAIGGRWGTSRNWSGAVIAARDGGMFDTVSGSWTVPVAAKPAGAAAAGSPPKGVWRQSVWIGLDGYRYFSRSLPQVGTVSQIGEFGPPRHYLWVQWWVRDKFFGEAEVKGFPVNAGDRIQATVEVRPTNGVRDNARFLVTNHGPANNPHTPPIAVTIDWRSGKYGPNPGDVLKPTGQQDNRQRGDAPAEGRHAVFCVERPSVMPPQHLLGQLKPHEMQPFSIPNFTEAVFSDAQATMRLPDGSIVERDLTAARQIRMIERSTEAVPRILFATTPGAPAASGRRLRVTQV